MRVYSEATGRLLREVNDCERAGLLRLILSTEDYVMIPWQQMLYGLKVTLTCPQCGEECTMNDPFKDRLKQACNFFRRRGPKPLDVPEAWNNEVNEAAMRHRVKGCKRAT